MLKKGAIINYCGTEYKLAEDQVIYDEIIVEQENGNRLILWWPGSRKEPKNVEIDRIFT